MKIFFLSIFLVTSAACRAQVLEAGYGPASHHGWGQLPKTARLNISLLKELYHYKSLHYTPGFRYTYINSKSNAVDRFDEKVMGKFHLVFAIPLSFDIILGRTMIISRLGAGAGLKSFPDKNGRRLNFLLETGLGYRIFQKTNISLRYSHISNGFRGRVNPGLDNVILTLSYHL